MALYVAIAVGYARATPKWNNPDEPAHYNYVKQVANTGTLPILQPGDYDQAYLEKLKPLQFPDDLPIDTIRYESHQPPLYYALAALAYRAAGGLSVNGSVLLLRGLSIALGALLILLAYRLVLEALPGRNWLALGTAGFVATLPMHTAMTAAINNDTLAEVVVAVALLLMLRGLRHGFARRLCLGLGLVLGAALLTKVTIYSTLGLALVALWARHRLTRQAIVATTSLSAVGAGVSLAGGASPAPRPAAAAAPSALWQVGLVYGTAAAVSWAWFLRNALVYGWTDPLGMARHDAIVVGQPRTAYTWAGLEHFLNTTFQSFWGQFGWMGIVLDRRVYQLLMVISAFAVVGLAVFVWRTGRQTVRFERTERWALVLLCACVLLAVAELVYYNLIFIQPQGRYLYPALVPIGLFFTIGLVEVIPRTFKSWGVVGMYIGLLALNGFSLVRFVVPYFKGG
ncbi:MAG: hypothetical protein ACYC7H_08805 [Chloroflexota bacterium]